MIRTMAQGAWPRHLYNIVIPFRRNDLRMFRDVIRSAIGEKCAASGIDFPAAADLVEFPLLA